MTELYEPAHYGTTLSEKGALITNASDVGYAQLLVPQDFTSITAIELIFLPTYEVATSMRFDIDTFYGVYDGGEIYNVHTEVDNGRGIGPAGAYENVAHDISDLVDIAALAAGDLLLVKVEYSSVSEASNAYLRGIRLKYS